MNWNLFNVEKEQFTVFKYRYGMSLVLFVIKCKAIKIVNLLKLASMRKWNADTFYVLFISSLHLRNTLKKMSMSND